MAENETEKVEETGIVVSGGVRYTAKDAKARGLKADTAAVAKKIANGDLPVGTYVPAGAKAGDVQAIPAPVSTASANTAPADKK
jgi:hypothetical protein